MFSKLPQTFSSPFGLLGDEAKLAFPTQSGGIAKLASARNIPDNDSYWEQYFVLFDSASDVFSLITPHHIRRALSDAPENVATLIRVTSSRLFNLLSDHTFPSSTTSVTAFASSFIKSGTGNSERNTTKEVLNCLRVLQRVLPVVFEVEGETNSFELEVLWKKEEVVEDRNDEEAGEIAQFVIEDEDDDNGMDGKAGTSQQPTLPQINKKQLPSLAERLFDAVFDLLFCCGFTLPTKLQVDHHKIQHVIWEKGIGSTLDVGPNTAYDNNKIEVLRLLLILLSRQIYVAATSLSSKPSLYTLHLVQKTPRRNVLTLLCSLLNTAINSTATADKTFGSMAGKLPYNHLVFKGEDPRSNLAGICFQVLCILLDFQSGSARDRVMNDHGDGGPLPTARTNAFRYFIMKLHRIQDFEFIHRGILNILDQQLASTNNVFPGARKSVPHAPETVLFLWKMLELNKKFCSYILESDNAMDLLAYLLCYGLEIKDKPQQHGLCRALSYIIQTLSAEPSFGSNLSNPLKMQPPTKYNVVGTAGDFMINAIYAMIATTSGALNSLYPALIIALSNSAPYFKSLTVKASSRLIQLFKSFSSPLFLLSDEGHPRLLFFMLEVFNSVIHHHPSENPNLLYGIISSHRIFEDLGTFTLARGLREIRRVQLTKEEQARRLENHSKDRSSIDSLDAGREKARLLENEAIASATTAPIQSGTSSPRHPEAHEDHPEQEGSRASPVATSNSPADVTIEEAISEKARGKMKERRSTSVDMSSTPERLVAAGIGRNGFVPTQEWVSSWQQGLPLDIVMLVISELLPKVQELQASRKADSTAAILDLLSTINLKHILPQAPPLSPRCFMWSDASIIWLTSLIWGEIYVRSVTPLGIWNATNVRLFYVKHTQSQQRQITETVSHVVGGITYFEDFVSTIPRQAVLSFTPFVIDHLLLLFHNVVNIHKLALDRGGIHTVADLLLTPPQQAARRCRLSPIDIKAIVDIVCRECNKIQIRCLEDVMLEGEELFTTGDADIDIVLGGGIRTGMVWEFVGESAAGKTQLALQVSLFVQVPPSFGGLDGSCCYLTTSSDLKLPTQRLLQIAESRKVLSSATCSLDNIHTISTPSITMLLYVLSHTLPDFIMNRTQTVGAKPVKLVVIDALAELFHTADKTTTATLVERSQNLAELASSLHVLAAEQRVAVVVLNEVVDVFDRGSHSSEGNFELVYNDQSRWFSRGDSVPGEDRKEASLGLVWANQVNARILMSRTGRRRYLSETENGKVKFQRVESRVREPLDKKTRTRLSTQDDDQPALLRRFNVIFSSVSSSASLDFIVMDSGIIALPGSITYPSADQDSWIPPGVTSLRDRRSALPYSEPTCTVGKNPTMASLDIDAPEEASIRLDGVGAGAVTLPEDEPQQEDEDGWDKFWEQDEIPTEVYLSVPNPV
ncbi:hypothetical protein AX17_005087 [Amanita inopinata Kibby_2008]|nr:hypothetical protein AX17_005087 [Amanita inopinata Kibby_2008]